MVPAWAGGRAAAPSARSESPGVGPPALRGTVRAGWHCRSRARTSEGGGSGDVGPQSESPVTCTVRAGGQSRSPARAGEGGGPPPAARARNPESPALRGTVRAGWHCRPQARADEGGGSDGVGPRSESPAACTARAGGQCRSPARAGEGGGLPSRRRADLVRVTCGLHRPGGKTMSLPGPGRWGRRAVARACTVRAGGQRRSQARADEDGGSPV